MIIKTLVKNKDRLEFLPSKIGKPFLNFEQLVYGFMYEVVTEEWGLHNTLIVSIIKNGCESISDEDSEFNFGYDDPRNYLPEEIIDFLDDEFPSS